MPRSKRAEQGSRMQSHLSMESATLRQLIDWCGLALRPFHRDGESRNMVEYQSKELGNRRLGALALGACHTGNDRTHGSIPVFPPFSIMTFAASNSWAFLGSEEVPRSREKRDLATQFVDSAEFSALEQEAEHSRARRQRPPEAGSRQPIFFLTSLAISIRTTA
eukprot:scaffold11_cov257-Pinguiococcus_pyrenoidosus.AAC.62